MAGLDELGPVGDPEHEMHGKRVFTSEDRDTRELRILVTQERIDMWAEVSGDRNPLHISNEYASTTRFGGTIAHGHFSVALIERLMAELVGPRWLRGGSLKEIRFTAPVRPGDQLTARAAARKDGTGARTEALWDVELARAGEACVVAVASLGSTETVPSAQPEEEAQ